jgi:uncharacterized membrane protein SirB2
MFGLGIACAGAAGVALAMLFPFSPNSQVQWLAWAFLGVILGGLGKVENTLAAGLVVGLIQTVCTALLPFDYVYLVLYLLLAAILILRREGLSRAARRALPVFSVFLIPPVRRSADVGVLVWALLARWRRWRNLAELQGINLAKSSVRKVAGRRWVLSEARKAGTDVGRGGQCPVWHDRDRHLRQRYSGLRKF